MYYQTYKSILLLSNHLIAFSNTFSFNNLSFSRSNTNNTTRNTLLTTNFSGQKLLLTTITNLNTNLKNKKLLITKILIIINKKL